MAYRIGIDAGSKTIKLVVLDELGQLVHHMYWRHRSDIRQTLIRMLNDFSVRYGNVEGPVAITGSAGIALAETLGLPFVQEVIATTYAVQAHFPDADAIVELGGEDAKVMYLSGNLEQRMNATCAGGTGGFIDTIAFMLGVRTSEMSHLAARATHSFPIASRCAVFAQTDVRPLLNAGASKEDIAGSVLDAVVRQTIGGLACGRPLHGTVVFLGGPFEFVPELSRRFACALNLSDEQAIRPSNAHLFAAIGAALQAANYGRDNEGKKDSEDNKDKTGGADGKSSASSKSSPSKSSSSKNSSNTYSLTQLGQLVRDAKLPENDLESLPPLFTNHQERETFNARHKKEVMPRASFPKQPAPLYLGFDAGSTTVKYALVNEEGHLVASGYRPTEGDVLESARILLEEMYCTLASSTQNESWIAQAIAIGYGADMLKVAFGMDADVVETTAHLRSAQAFRPDVSFVLDIGGQDMKALWVEDGCITDAVLNEACSSGCGAFIEGTAHSLGKGPEMFASSALAAKNPVDLGTKCTVFMTSKVRHAQKVGVSKADISAGIAYSVVQNALYRVIGRGKASNLGHCAVVQGGAFKSDAVLRAFELVSGIEVVRPDTAHLMGAIGAALIARDHAWELREDGEKGKYGEDDATIETITDNTSAPSGVSNASAVKDTSAPSGMAEVSSPSASQYVKLQSKLISAEELSQLEVRYGTWRCTGCTNACALSIVDFGEGRMFASGNRCPRGETLALQALEAGCIITNFNNGLAQIDPSGNLAQIAQSSVTKNMTSVPASQTQSKRDMTKVRYVPPPHLAKMLGERALPGKPIGDPFAMHRRNIIQDISWAEKDGNELHRRWAELVRARVQDDQSADHVTKSIAVDKGDEETVAVGTDSKKIQLTETTEIPRGSKTSEVSESAEILGTTKTSTTVESLPFSKSSETEKSIKDLSCQLNKTIPYKRTGIPLNHEKTSDQAPNVIAYEQALLASYGTQAKTNQLNIGLVSSMESLENLPFWHTLFHSLGFGVVVADAVTTSQQRDAAAESIPSESVCEPAKLSHAQIYALRQLGPDAVFMPCYVRGSRCAVTCGYGNALLDSVPFLEDGSTTWISPLLQSIRPDRLVTSEKDTTALLEALNQIPLDQPIASKTFRLALKKALQEQQAFVESVRAKTDQALAWIAKNPNRHGIVVGGRPYHIDQNLLHNIDVELQDLGFAVLPMIGLRSIDKKGAEVKDDKQIVWKPAKHLLKAAQCVVENPQLDLIVIQSFNCGYDAVSLEDAHDVISAAGRPFTALKIDEIADTAHIRIRLRTMAQTIIQKKRQLASLQSEKQSLSKEFTRNEACIQAGESDAVSTKACDPVNLAAINSSTLETVRTKVPADICFTAAALMASVIDAVNAFEAVGVNEAIDTIGVHDVADTDMLPNAVNMANIDTIGVHDAADTADVIEAVQEMAVREIEDDGKSFSLRIPRVCKDCLVDALPKAVLRACGTVPQIEWVDSWDDNLSDISFDAAPNTVSNVSLDVSPSVAPGGLSSESQIVGLGKKRKSSIRVGIVGNPLLCFDRYMNEDLLDLLADLGVEAVLPDPELLFVEDVRYFPQLDCFAEDGVDAVLYLQSFGCLKGHVQARGAAHTFAKRYPNMSVTVIDYDPESSALNRENRIRLAVEAARLRKLN